MVGRKWRSRCKPRAVQRNTKTRLKARMARLGARDQVEISRVLDMVDSADCPRDKEQPPTKISR
eukprot:10292432-Lingulodinium_polyedra.AAC.1